MRNISTVPMPVAAHACGRGSFFGSCQAAAGNFDAIFQSAISEQPSAFPSDFESFSELVEGCDKGETLARLQNALGREAGDEAFGLAMKIAGSGEIFNSLSPEGQKTIEAAFNPEFIAEATGDIQKIALEAWLEKMKAMFGDDDEDGNASAENKESLQMEESLETDELANMFSDIKLLADKMGIKPEYYAEFEKMVNSLLESGKFSFQDIVDILNVISQNIADVAGDDEDAHVMNVLAELLFLVKDEKEIKTADLLRKIPDLMKNFGPAAEAENSPHTMAAHELKPSHIRPMRICHANFPSGVTVTFSRAKNIEDASFAVVHGDIKMMDDLRKTSPNFFTIEMNLASGEFSILSWTQFGEKVETEGMRGNLDSMEIEGMEDSPIKEVLLGILKTLREKLVKHSGEGSHEHHAHFAPHGFSAPHSFSKALSQDIEQDETLQKFFLLLKMLKNNEGLTKEEKAELAAIIDSRFNLAKHKGIEEAENGPAIEEGEDSEAENKIGAAEDEDAGEELDLEKYLLDPEKAQKHKGKGMKAAAAQAEQAQAPQTQTMQAQPKQMKQMRQALHAQPEVRAVWEGGNLKIEAFDSKTGEKLQTISARAPRNMQERIHEFEVVKQVVAQAKLITTPTGDQRMTIQLRPEHLGQVDLRITLHNSEMQIQARVESPVAQAALESHIGLLREGLEKQGIALDRLEVSVEQRDRQDAFSLAERQDREEQRQSRQKNRRGKEQHLAVSISSKDPNADTGRRHGYNTMEYLA